MSNLIENIKNSKLSIEKLSSKSGISIENLNSILNGIEPSMIDLKKISKALNLSIDFLISEKNEFEEINLLFRKAIPDNNQKQIADRFSHIIGNSLKLLSDYKVNECLINNYNVEIENSYLNAESLAAKFRNDFFNSDFYSPLLNLPQIIDEKLNCVLYVTEFGNNIDGASAIINGVPYIFISPRFGPRMLYTLAHELGHILAHHDFNENFVNFDKNISTNRDKRKDEQFANAFASNLLLPSQGISLTLKKLREYYKNEGSLGDIEILYLSRIYGVSFEVAARRCEDLRFIPEGGAISLYEVLKKNHGSPEKRAEDVGLPDRFEIKFPKVSNNIIKLAIEKINNGEISIGKASEILDIPIPVLISNNALVNI